LLLIFRLEIPQITAVSIETAFQNGGIAFILLRLSLPEPFGDLASVAPVAQLMITGQKKPKEITTRVSRNI
jgi:sodium/bile acid cotransporter 3/5